MCYLKGSTIDKQVSFIIALFHETLFDTSQVDFLLTLNTIQSWVPWPSCAYINSVGLQVCTIMAGMKHTNLSCLMGQLVCAHVLENVEARGPCASPSLILTLLREPGLLAGLAIHCFGQIDRTRASTSASLGYWHVAQHLALYVDAEDLNSGHAGAENTLPSEFSPAWMTPFSQFACDTKPAPGQLDNNILSSAIL